MFPSAGFKAVTTSECMSSSTVGVLVLPTSHEVHTEAHIRMSVANKPTPEHGKSSQFISFQHTHTINYTPNVPIYLCLPHAISFPIYFIGLLLEVQTRALCFYFLRHLFLGKHKWGAKAIL